MSFVPSFCHLGPNDWKFALILAGLVLVAYAPAFNNGFISDDYVLLERLRILRHNPLYLFSIPPDNFRYTSYACFALLKSIFGYRPACFYAFTVLLHIASAVMLGRYLQIVSGSAAAAALGSLFFAAVQNHQEAVMWLAGMNELLLGLFILGTLLAWLKERYLIAVLFYALALLSKESSIAMFVLVPLTDFYHHRKFVLRRQYIYLLVPALLAAALYVYTWHSNELHIQHYAIGPHGFLVELNSLHRLAFPWIYIATLLLLANKRLESPKVLLVPAAWVVLALGPYIFLTYQNHVPSRNQYIACMGTAWLLALLVDRLPGGPIKCAFVAVFLVANMAYLWFVKDAQYEERAAPTSQLVRELRLHSPDRVLILNFPLNPWIAKDTALHVPGWRPELIMANEPPEACSTCWTLSWDARSQRYSTVR